MSAIPFGWGGPAKELFDDEPFVVAPPPVRLEEPPGLLVLEVLCPVWRWKGDPPVLQLEAVPWRPWQELQIALELEQRILRKNHWYTFEDEPISINVSFG